MIHGGDIYRNQVSMDFSVNINPLGMPEGVRIALVKAAALCTAYPDPAAEQLKKAVSAMLSVPKELLLFGNGASELFLAITHALRPQKTVIPIPSFYGYEHAAAAVCENIIYYPMKPEEGFCLDEAFFSALDEKTELLFLANPNNPTGNRLEPKQLECILQHCREKHISVVLDESFIEFCGPDASMLPYIGEYDNLLLIRAFTKSFAIPGVRLGYLLSSNMKLLQKIERQLPEWNLSTFAQAAGIACSMEGAFMERTVAFLEKERKFLAEGLRKAGVTVFPQEANFMLVHTEIPLYEKLLKRGILIRDCSNFRGLSKGYYRIAVRERKENEMLLKRIGECI